MVMARRKWAVLCRERTRVATQERSVARGVRIEGMWVLRGKRKSECLGETHLECEKGLTKNIVGL